MKYLVPHKRKQKYTPLLRKMAVVFFALVLLLVNTPMDFIHEFTGHKDGIHEKHTGLEITVKHHHCSFLSLSVTPFANDIQLPEVHFYSPEYFPWHATLPVYLYTACSYTPLLRGPPMA